MKSKSILVLAAALFFSSVGTPAFAAAKAGAKCSKAGATETVGSTKFTCIKSGKTLVWNKGVKASSSAKETVAQSNARRAAGNYLALTAFSRSGLIEQLEFEGFSTADATYGTDAQNADWNAMAAKAAKNYLTLMAFSRSGLIEQLQFEGYTAAQAAYGATAVGL
jgi:hypothetical protein